MADSRTTLPAAPALAVQKPLSFLTPDEEAKLFDRGRASDPEVERAVASLVVDVRERGDDALREQTLRFDGVALEAVEVPSEAGAAALEVLDPDIRRALEQAIDAIAAFHRAQLPPPLEVEVQPGVRLGRRAEPLRRVGVYAPGGRAAYPSSVLMGVVPARVAGVEEVVVCSPAGPDGLPPAEVLAACVLAGADRVFALGGAGAIAAMALGTASVPRVDKIVGPGNAYVTEAKRQLTGEVAIDCPAGPSEVLVVADESADPDLVAVELIAQAEHDPDAAAVLVTPSTALAEAAGRALGRLLAGQPRRAIIEQALAARGAILVARSLGQALGFARRYAPEHLVLMVADPRAALDRVEAAGTVFLGASSSVAFGDYMTGANHVLPTNGLARAYSGLSALDFVRFTTYQELSAEAAARLAGPTATLADAEGLPGHALAARMRASAASDDETAMNEADPRTVAAGEDAPDASASNQPADRTTAALPLRAAYRDVPLYDPERRPVDVDLSDNTGLFGPPPSAARILAELKGDALTRYPEVYASALKDALAALHGVEPENIVTGCGLDDVIDSAMRAFGEPGHAVAYADPTFGMVPLFARMNALRPVAVPLDVDPAEGFRLDADRVLAQRARLTYLCRPNNPTGTLLDRTTIERIAAESPGIVLLDEAYADFAGESMTAWAAGSTRVVALRTLSKAWGLAGLRIGYGVGPAALVREIEKSRGPYKITAAADAAARVALANDLEVVRGNVALTRLNRERLRAELEALGLRVWPSEANFLLVAAPETVPGPPSGERGVASATPAPATPAPTTPAPTTPAPAPGSATRLADALRARGVAVRAFPALPGAGESVRVTVGPWGMMERLLDAVRDVLQGGES